MTACTSWSVLSRPDSTLCTTPSSPPDSEPLLQVQKPWKVLGSAQQKFRGPPDLQALSRRELTGRTACTAAVGAASFDVPRGEVLMIRANPATANAWLLGIPGAKPF